jgi:hypothetical protein
VLVLVVAKAKQMRASSCLRSATALKSVRPVDGPFAFQLRAPAAVGLPLLNLPASVSAIAAAALEEADCVRFCAQVQRWGGPEDTDADGCQPYAQQQLLFKPRPWDAPVDLESVLQGTVQVLTIAYALDCATMPKYR